MSTLTDRAGQPDSGSAPTIDEDVVGNTVIGTVEVTEIPIREDTGPATYDAVGSNTKQALSDVGPALRADAEDLKYRAEDYVIEHPIQAVAVGLGVGFVLGVLWTRRR